MLRCKSQPPVPTSALQAPSRASLCGGRRAAGGGRRPAPPRLLLCSDDAPRSLMQMRCVINARLGTERPAAHRWDML